MKHKVPGALRPTVGLATQFSGCYPIKVNDLVDLDVVLLGLVSRLAVVDGWMGVDFYCTEMCSSSGESSYSRLIDVCITQL